MRIRTTAPESYDYAHTVVISSTMKEDYTLPVRIVEITADTPERELFLTEYQRDRYRSGMYSALILKTSGDL